MKAMVAMELAVMRLLADQARAAGRDPATDPIPGLTRDVLFASTAGEEAGGVEGAGWIAEHRPELLRAAGCINEAGGVSLEVAGRRFYPIQVAEKGFIRLPDHGPRHVGPRLDAARGQRRGARGRGRPARSRRSTSRT